MYLSAHNLTGLTDCPCLRQHVCVRSCKWPRPPIEPVADGFDYLYANQSMCPTVRILIRLCVLLPMSASTDVCVQRQVSTYEVRCPLVCRPAR